MHKKLGKVYMIYTRLPVGNRKIKDNMHTRLPVGNRKIKDNMHKKLRTMKQESYDTFIEHINNWHFT